MRNTIRRLLLSKLLTSSGLLLAGMTIVNAGNYLFNLLLGRWLGPVAFADLSLIVTLFLVITFVTSALQTIAAKYAASYTAEGTPQSLFALRTWLTRVAWGVGLVGLAIFALGAPIWASFFQTQNVWMFVIFAVGVPFYFVQGVDRGILQGQTRFSTMAISYQIEMWVRLVVGCGLVLLGLSVGGGVLGLTISILATWTFTHVRMSRSIPAVDGIPALSPVQREQIRSFALPVILGLLGQIMINNSDVLAVKRFFTAEQAGGYAALALIGRIVFFATWSVVTTLFPIVAQRHQRGEPHRQLLAVGLGLVASISLMMIAATFWIPELIVQLLFSEAYLSMAPLLGLYAVATTLYALANVIITYHLSLGHGFGSILALIAGVLQILCLILIHGSLYNVVMVQVIVLGALFFTLIVWDFWLVTPIASLRRLSLWRSHYFPE